MKFSGKAFEAKNKTERSPVAKAQVLKKSSLVSMTKPGVQKIKSSFPAKHSRQHSQEMVSIDQ